MAKCALITNDRPFIQDEVDQVASCAGIEIPPDLRPVVERAGPHVLEEVLREEARRELEVYAEAAGTDRSLGALPLPVQSGGSRRNRPHVRRSQTET